MLGVYIANSNLIELNPASFGEQKIFRNFFDERSMLMLSVVWANAVQSLIKSWLEGSEKKFPLILTFSWAVVVV